MDVAAVLVGLGVGGAHHSHSCRRQRGLACVGVGMNRVLETTPVTYLRNTARRGCNPRNASCSPVTAVRNTNYTYLNLTLYQRYRVRRRRLPLHGAATRASSRAGLRECMGVKPADSSAKLPSLLLVVWGIPRVVLRVEGGLRRVHTRTDGAAGVCIPARACWW